MVTHAWKSGEAKSLCDKTKILLWHVKGITSLNLLVSVVLICFSILCDMRKEFMEVTMSR
ncbi:CLUMA_CG010159, isoform A [Clunio marinus]|uniref:CLUMA_CG010159, isoform A n=1 Tax=Clunio marinus TaxID=568069 RepID=A0A1J1I867_9DIPT|nr:CLUMA_CG010159, isoform A [Clunio marinus]